MKHVAILAGVALLAAGCQQQAAAPPADSRIDALVDRQAIDQLVAGDYPHALDHQDWTTYASYYTEDGELLLGGQTAKGREAIITMLSALPPDSKVIHVISNSSYVIKGDSATGGAYWQDIGVADTRQGVVAAGHYEDTLRKVAGVWQFAKRSIVVEFVPTPAAVPAAAAK